MSPSPYPNIWAPGGLFAFSGLDGPTDYYSPLVASLLEQGIGLHLHVAPPLALTWDIDVENVDWERSVVGCDVLELVSRDGAVALGLAFADKDALVGYGALPEATAAAPARTFVGGPAGQVSIAKGDGHFSIALGRDDATAAVRAAGGLGSDPRAVVAQRKRFFTAAPACPADDGAVAATYAKSLAVLKCNTYAPQGDLPCFWTTPDRWPHRHMWLWDSAFHAIALRRLSADLAADAIRAVLLRQQEDGFIPHMMGPDATTRSTITQPPVLAWATWKVCARGDQRDFVEWAYPRLGRYVAWDLRHRDRDQDGLAEWVKDEDDSLCHCGESGMDNSPRFDRPGPQAAVDLNSMLVAECEALAKMATVLGEAGEAEAWLRSRGRLAALIDQRLWSEDESLYLDGDAAGSVTVPSSASFLPLYAGVPSATRAKRLVASLLDERRFWRPLPVPSVAADHPAYSDDMWRGPTWLNTNYMVIEGLLRYGYRSEALQLARSTVRDVSHWYQVGGCLYEYYDAESTRAPWDLSRKRNTGVGTIRDYGWSAAMYVELVHFLAGDEEIVV
ncbi:MAG: amylo-alpha-1,6-glucosidase [Anaerolineae bacterium]